MTEFIKLLPEIIAPLIVGGIFTFIFKIIALRPQEIDYESRFVTYYLFGFVIHYIGQSLCELLNISIKTFHHTTNNYHCVLNSYIEGKMSLMYRHI